MRCFYFGVWDKGGAGHYLHVPGGTASRREAERVLPFAMHILDSHLLPQEGPQTEGIVYRSLINGWTVLSFWDRSGDSRGRSNSAFIMDGDYATLAGLAIARERFPAIFARFGFALAPAEALVR